MPREVLPLQQIIATCDVVSQWSPHGQQKDWHQHRHAQEG